MTVSIIRKLLPNLLDTDKDILRQKSLALCSINKLKHIYVYISIYVHIYIYIYIYINMYIYN